MTRRRKPTTTQQQRDAFRAMLEATTPARCKHGRRAKECERCNPKHFEQR